MVALADSNKCAVDPSTYQHRKAATHSSSYGSGCRHTLLLHELDDPRTARTKEDVERSLLCLSECFPGKQLLFRYTTDSDTEWLVQAIDGIVTCTLAQPSASRLIVTRMAAVALPSKARAILVEGDGTTSCDGHQAVLYALTPGCMVAETLPLLKASPEGRKLLFMAPRLLTGNTVGLRLRLGTRFAPDFVMKTDLLRLPDASA